ncbi:hypothetical protein HF882_10730 [Victivallis vadensis]|uniref:Uncharacterized protein n=1 Tax=Victivallis vadensis TaxID=172901 RepID=A0A848AZX5_9BACT|nr:hypothetical protein [Victivallis vadensis]NMD87060.1 hypothetical protein [Victivallis vadensis]
MSRNLWKKITPDDGHYFFGYYDRNPWNCDGSRHLALKAPQCERQPPGDPRIGVKFFVPVFIRINNPITRMESRNEAKFYPY